MKTFFKIRVKKVSINLLWDITSSGQPQCIYLFLQCCTYTKSCGHSPWCKVSSVDNLWKYVAHTSLPVFCHFCCSLQLCHSSLGVYFTVWLSICPSIAFPFIFCTNCLNCKPILLCTRPMQSSSQFHSDTLYHTIIQKLNTFHSLVSANLWNNHTSPSVSTLSHVTL
jgi:hypothetical protein